MKEYWNIAGENKLMRAYVRGERNGKLSKKTRNFVSTDTTALPPLPLPFPPPPPPPPPPFSPPPPPPPPPPSPPPPFSPPPPYSASL
ncbi:hypothetical protein RCL_jg10.t1 [Rhizophagus clarus]|uniref:Uncharacterized protein n=1 Tax=Rhizophagus clarus TaxID=94130 RepID=A0A8H3M1G7_9GLOM|nr:hypothetical protein RCL_jg10.t1 [Rhizophagus clarus]